MPTNRLCRRNRAHSSHHQRSLSSSRTLRPLRRRTPIRRSSQGGPKYLEELRRITEDRSHLPKECSEELRGCFQWGGFPLGAHADNTLDGEQHDKITKIRVFICYRCDRENYIAPTYPETTTVDGDVIDPDPNARSYKPVTSGTSVLPIKSKLQLMTNLTLNTNSNKKTISLPTSLSNVPPSTRRI
mmetsp:Transcript_27156/g.74472  ORF Transcript_27156/g.74472 Transcript_27156/m.74472 type:complete len:186 (+) Transcript_27156:473-1030(+)